MYGICRVQLETQLEEFSKLCGGGEEGSWTVGGAKQGSYGGIMARFWWRWSRGRGKFFYSFPNFLRGILVFDWSAAIRVF